MSKVNNTDDLRAILVEEIDLIKSGESNPSRANAIANMVGKILTSVKVDIEAHKYVTKAAAANLAVPLTKQIKDGKEKGG